MRRTSGTFASIGIGILGLALVGFAAACGDGDGTASSTDPPAAASDLQEAIDQIDAMVIAAEAGDLAAAEGAFDAAHDSLHEIIEGLETSDPDQAAALDEAVEHAEEDFADNAEAEHIVGNGQEIRGLLGQVQ